MHQNVGEGCTVFSDGTVLIHYLVGPFVVWQLHRVFLLWRESYEILI